MISKITLTVVTSFMLSPTVKFSIFSPDPLNLVFDLLYILDLNLLVEIIDCPYVINILKCWACFTSSKCSQVFTVPNLFWGN